MRARFRDVRCIQRYEAGHPRSAFLFVEIAVPVVRAAPVNLYVALFWLNNILWWHLSTCGYRTFAFSYGWESDSEYSARRSKIDLFETIFL